MGEGHGVTNASLADQHSTIQSHKRTLRILSIGGRALALALAYFGAQLSLFDSSPRLVLPDASSGPLSELAYVALRWDAFHFAHIATHGYVFEHEWAFFPGIALVMRGTGHAMRAVKRVVNPATGSGLSVEDVVQGAALAALMCDGTQTLYELTLHHFSSPTFAFIAALLSLLPSSPATLYFAPYTEPFFTYLSYKGMLYCARSQWLLATFAFILASAFRSNGVLLGGFVLWGMIVQPMTLAESRRPSALTVAYSLLLTLAVFAPSLAYQYTAYRLFCLHPTTAPAPWCAARLPSIYTHTQATYWGVGFLKYWTAAQAPNILLAAPVLALLVAFSTYHLAGALPTLVPRVLATLGLRARAVGPATTTTPTPTPQTTDTDTNADVFLRPSLTPHALHALVLAALLLTASHTQIALRLAAALPLTYWAAAWLVLRRPRAARAWVAWAAAWGAISVVCFAAFLPPA